MGGNSRPLRSLWGGDRSIAKSVHSVNAFGRSSWLNTRYTCFSRLRQPLAMPMQRVEATGSSHLATR